MTLGPSCWVVTNGVTGTEIQCLGLAEALGLAPVVKRVVPRRVFLVLPPLVWGQPSRGLTRQGDRLEPPWPDLVIASGWESAAPAAALRVASRRRRPDRPTYVVQLQRPQFPASFFDLVVAPQHDLLRGPNVLASLGSIHRITPAKLAAAAPLVAEAVAGLPRPRVAVLLGGSTRLFRFEAAEAAALGAQLAAMARREGASLLVTGSRRTGPGVLEVLRAALQGVPHLVWDGSGDNPYLGWLAHADAAVVTRDSVNMTCEAAAAGLPVLVAPLERGNAKFDRFHQAMQAAGLSRPFAGQLEIWRQPPFDEPARLAKEIKARLPLPWP